MSSPNQITGNPPSIPDAELLTVKQVADVLQLSDTTLRMLERRKQLLPVRVGRNVRYRRVELLRFLDSLSSTANTTTATTGTDNV
jgi:excisionase family DNA binding protein